MIVLVLVSLLFGAFFSASQVAFAAASRLRVEIRARDTGILGRIATAFVTNAHRLVVVTLVGRYLALTVFATATAIALHPGLLRLFGTTLPLTGAMLAIAVLIAQTTIASALAIIVNDLVPKAIAREVPTRTAFLLAVPLQVAHVLLWPLVATAGLLTRGLARLLGTETQSLLPAIVRKDIESLIEQGQENGVLSLDDEGQSILSNAFAMDSIRVRESMIPRTEVEAVEDTATIAELRECFIETGFSKLPVYGENIDNIVGIAFAHDLFDNPTHLSEVMRPPRFVPASSSSKTLLRDFLATNTSVAIVLDEYGGMAGIVTREDLLEELIGDIKDEFDTEELVLKQLNASAWLVSGRADLHTLASRLNVELPDGDYETVAGYILEKLGSIPKQNEEFGLGEYRFSILRSTATRIDLVRISRIERTEPADTPPPKPAHASPAGR